MKRVFVIAPLLGRQRSVGLHTYVEDVRGVSGDTTEEAGGAGHSDQGQDSGGLGG